LSIRIAIIGCGGFAGVHARRLAELPEAQVVALQDASQDQLEKFSHNWYSSAPNPPAMFLDREQMYRVTQPDAVVICTPHTLHFEHGMQALEFGCHVLMEKPMVTDSKQARQLAEAAKDRVFVIGYNTPCTAAFGHLKRIIAANELGELQMVTGWISQDWKRMTTGSWRQDPSLSGGGQMYDSGAHMFNSLVWSVDCPVQTVFAMADHRETPVDINGCALIKFENDVLASITISGDCAHDATGMNYIFSDGLVEIDGWSGTYIRYKRRGENDWIVPDLGESSNPDKNFVNAILGREQPLAVPRHGVLQSQLMDAIYASVKTGAAVSPSRDFETV